MAERTWSEEELDQLKDDVIALLKERGMWIDTAIYVNGNCYRYRSDAPDQIQFEEDVDPRNYFDYVRNKGNIFSMSFEGPLYEVLNYYVSGFDDFIEQFNSLFYDRGLYFEQGNAWNFSCFPV